MPILLDSLKKITSYNYAKKNLNHNFSWKSFQWYIIERGQNYALRIKDFDNDLITEINKIPTFRINPSWRINGFFKAYLKKQTR